MKLARGPILLVAIWTIGFASSAQANSRVWIEHEAPVPCSIACPYWDAPRAAGFDPCAAPFPQGSWDETTLTFVSDGFASIETQPWLDYDTFVCTDTTPRRLVASLARPLELPPTARGASRTEACITGSCCPANMGCAEDGWISRTQLHRVNGGANDRFVVVSYNWFDYQSLPIRITGSVEIVDDTFTATPI